MVDVAEVLAKPLAQQLIREQPLLRMSYTGLDGGPRVIPLGFLWDGTVFRIWTAPNSAKVRALAADPRVAIVIDVGGVPPRTLLMRGTVELETVDGVPDGYLESSHRTMPPEQWPEFDAQVRGLYDSMTTLTVTLTWAKLLDYETTAPRAIEELARRRAAEAEAR